LQYFKACPNENFEGKPQRDADEFDLFYVDQKIRSVDNSTIFNNVGTFACDYMSEKKEAIVISAEAGMGKSQFCRELQKHLQTIYPHFSTVLLNLPNLSEKFRRLAESSLNRSRTLYISSTMRN